MNDFFDCVNWRIVGSAPNCALHMDPAGCPTCDKRVSRRGNFRHPPVYYVPSVHPALSAQKPEQEPAIEAPKDEKPCCQETVEKSRSRIRGLGDVVAAATSAVGVKPCGGCKKRQEALNKMFPFGKPDAGGETKPQ
jgi:hypothetical protein